MQFSIESAEGLERKVKVELPEEQVTPRVERRLQDVQRSARLDGFRPGKVPMSVVRKRFGAQVRQDVFGDLVESTFLQAARELGLRLAAPPKSVEWLDKAAGEGMGYIATVEVMPEIAIADLSGVTVERPVAEVTDENVEAMIAKLRKQRVTWAPVGRAAAEGDQVLIDFIGKLDGAPFDGGEAKGYALVLGSGTMIPGFEAGLVGASAGEARNLEVTMPADYRAEHLAGKSVVFEVQVQEVREGQLPELDDAFARSFDVAEGGVEALKVEVRKNMQRELGDRIREMVKKQAMDALLAQHPIECPKGMVEQESGVLRDQFQSELTRGYQGKQSFSLPLSIFEDQAKRRVALGLIIAEIIRSEGIQPDEARMRARAERFAESFEKPEEIINYYLTDAESKERLRNLVLEDQVVDWVLGRANVVDVAKGFDDLMNNNESAA